PGRVSGTPGSERHHDRDDHGPAAGSVAHELARTLAHHALQCLDVVVASLQRGDDQRGDPVPTLVEQFLGLRGVDPALGDDLRAGDYGPLLVVDRDDHDDDALFGQDLAVPQNAVAHVADDPVDEGVPGRDPAVANHPLVGEQDPVAVLAHEDVVGGDTHDPP